MIAFAMMELLSKILELVHERFYAAYEARKPEEESHSPRKKSGKRHEPPVEYDVRVRIVACWRWP